jgi:hypothetical protein
MVGEGMSKQDRQGVRTPADIERKYDLGSLTAQNQNQSQKVIQLTQMFMQFEATVNARLDSMNERISASHPLGSYYIGVNNTNPNKFFGGGWELVSQGYIVVGLDQENEEDLAELQFLDKCYIWKRTA